MNKIFKDEKIFNKFKKEFKFIFRNQDFMGATSNHFDKKGLIAAFTLSFLQNRISTQQVWKHVKINQNDWLDMFVDFYCDSNVIHAYESIALNPLISLGNIQFMFDCFEPFIDKIFDYIKEQNWSLNISYENAKQLLKNAFGYIMYNCIECKLEYRIPDLLETNDYDKKYTMVLNNTKLFANTKKSILENCGQKINDLIVILLGGSNHLALVK